MNDEDNFMCYLLGLIDGEGCFYVEKSKCKTTKCGYRSTPGLKIALNLDRDSIDLFLKIRDFLGTGYVRPYKNYNGHYQIEYRVGGIKGSKKLCDIFEKYSEYIKIRRAPYNKWRSLVYRMKNGEHLTRGGFQDISELCKKINYHNPKNYIIKNNRNIFK
jgi:hypothetical protein